MKRLVNKPLGQLLLEKEIISKGQLDKALEIQKQKGGLLGQILVSLGYVDEKDIAQAIMAQYGYPYLPLENYDLNKEIVKMVPENVARQYGLVVIDKMGDMITVAMCNPLNIHAIEDLELLTKCKAQVFVSTLTDIQRTIDKCYSDE